MSRYNAPPSESSDYDMTERGTPFETTRLPFAKQFRTGHDAQTNGTLRAHRNG